jgi:hypothetical protein
VAKDEPIVVIEKLRDELIITADKVKSGEITPTKGNSIANLYRTALYAEQVRYQLEKGQDLRIELEGCAELSQADRERLDNISKLLDPQTKRG